MRLPDPLYTAMLAPFNHHGLWHFVRIPANINKPGYENAKMMFPHVKMKDQPGSGEEFLRFHRLMIRHFKWIIANTPNVNYRYSPWTELPQFVVDRIIPSIHLAEALAGIQTRINLPAAEELGAFIEPTQIHIPYPAGSGLHSDIHSCVSSFENLPVGSGADMSDIAQAQFNDYFWKLHGWIDGFFAQWQAIHGEAVDLSPLDPNMPGGGMHGM